METFLLQQVLFFVLIILTLFLPGWLILRTHHHGSLSPYEIAVLAFALSFTLVTLIYLTLNKLGISLSVFHMTLILLFINACAVCDAILMRRHTSKTLAYPRLSAKHRHIALVLIVLMLLIKTSFLAHTIFPTATDLGHHMFWVQKIITSHTLPPYEKIPIIPRDPVNAITSSATFGPPQRIADFIVGEHLIFAIIGAISHQSVVSAFPSLLLYLFHLCTILLLFLFAQRLFTSLRYGAVASLFVLALIGPLYAISGAQAKFVSGGVIGNVIGNLLIIAILYYLYRAVKERSRFFMILAILHTIALIYTHHLSTFILGYTLFGIAIALFIFDASRYKHHLTRLLRLVLDPRVLLLIISALLFGAIIYAPSYLTSDAITSSVGAPSKSTRTGIALRQLFHMSGEARFAFGICGAGFLLLAYNTRRRLRRVRKHLLTSRDALHPYARAILFGWFMMIFLMSTLPALLHVNIISSRIATYIVFPSVLLAGLVLGWLWTTLHKVLPVNVAFTLLAFCITFLWIDGMRDNNTSLATAPKTQPAIQTFHASTYLRDTVPTTTWILKDHNYVTADTWMKVFIATDYSNPLSRSYFKRYETRPHREHCTREMISHPSSAQAEACIQDLHIGPIVVDTQHDAQQFLQSDHFVKVYQNNDTSIFWYK